MPLATTCRKCGRDMVESPTGLCLRCRHELEPTPAAGTPVVATLVEPGRPQLAEAVSAPPSPPQSKPRMPISQQAAIFSCGGPFLLFVVNTMFAHNSAEGLHGEFNSTAAMLVSLLNLVIVSAASVLSIVGLVGGIQRRASGTIGLSLLGLLLSGLFIFAILSTLVLLQGLPGR